MKRISIERMAEIWRAVTHQDWSEKPESNVTFGEVVDLSFEAATFGEFLDVNRDRVQLYEEAAV